MWDYIVPAANGEFDEVIYNAADIKLFKEITRHQSSIPYRFDATWHIEGGFVH